MDDPELAKAIEYAQKLLDAAMDVVGVAPEHVELNPDDWAQDPKVVRLTILCRSISNFRAALLLVQDEHQKLEPSVLVRLLYENHLWLAALRERGPEFVQDMHKDERYHLEALSELAL